MKTVWLALFVIFALSEQKFERFFLDDPQALCLDGSPGVVYFQEGTVKDRVLLYFHGGGWCGAGTFQETLLSCLKRTTWKEGTSKLWPQIIDFPEGVLSNAKGNLYVEWSKAYLVYCDGAGHQGSRKEPIYYNDTKMYFRGYNITVAQLNMINNKSGMFTSAVKDIVVTGESAGGMAVFTWINYIRNLSHPSTKVWAIPDSGMFLDARLIGTDIHEYRNRIINVMRLANADLDPPTPKCIADNQNQKWKCMLFQHLYKYVTSPIFVVQSQYDAWCLREILGTNCFLSQTLTLCDEQQRKYIQTHHQNVTKLINQIVSIPGNGAWAPVCVNHCYSTDRFNRPQYTVPMNSNWTLLQAQSAWLDQTEQSHVHVDSGSWPDNKPCSGLSN